MVGALKQIICRIRDIMKSNNNSPNGDTKQPKHTLFS